MSDGQIISDSVMLMIGVYLRLNVDPAIEQNRRSVAEHEACREKRLA